MKVLFIYPSNDISYPLQIGSLSAYVKKFNHQTKLLNLLVKRTLSREHFNEIESVVENFEPDFIAFSCYETAFPWVKEITSFVKKKWPKVITIIGGYFPTLCPEEVISASSVDIICRGEGEMALEELLKSKGRNFRIKNLWFKKDGRITRNSIRPLVENLDELPYPDKEMFDYQKHLDQAEKKGERMVKVMASRGCPYECTYCCNKYFRQLYSNKERYLRVRSPKNVVSELKELKRRYRFEKVGFHDDNLTLSINWLKEFCRLYRKEVNLPFYCATRVESCSPEVLDLLQKSGCYLLLIGVESGNEEYRRGIMKRFMSNEQIIDVFRRARQKGILTWSFTMVGLPQESRTMLLQTLLLNWHCRPDFVMASVYYPFKGTELGNFCYKNNLVDFKKKEKVFSYAWESVLKQEELSAFEIRLAKYLNCFIAARSSLFWRLLVNRLKMQYE